MKKINQVYKNFYTDTEYHTLSEYIEKFARHSFNYTKEYELGRYYGVIKDVWNTAVCIGNFPEDLLLKTQRFAEEHFGVKDLEIFDIIIIKYCNDFGFVPKLDPHKDGGTLKKYTIDYQYKANVDWGISVENDIFVLSNNEALTFIGTEQKHGRPGRIFSDNEYVENIFFQFIEKRKQNEQ